ncbi:MAG: PhzF family phenazine biosynthesis protein [Verrucomicrobiota bacterium]
MKIPIFQVDAFAERVFEGNPAAVCLLDSWLPDATLQAIAEENNLSETAFVVPGDGAHGLRWFTPTTEVDLCGHATLGAAHVMFARMSPEKGRITFETRSGLLPVLRDGDLLTLDFPIDEGVACDAPIALVEALGIAPDECYRATDYLVVLTSESAVADLTPDVRGFEKLDLRGVIVTAPGRDVDFVSRFFAPKDGVDEDPVTGSAHCALTPYWAGRLGRDSLIAMQISKRTGRLGCRVSGDRVLISGRVLDYLEGQIEIDDVNVEAGEGG